MRFPGLLGLAFSLLVVFAVASPAAAQPAGSVVFSASRDGDHELYRVAAAGGSVTRLTRNRSSDSAPAVSPNGRLVAFVSTGTATRRSSSCGSTAPRSGR